MGDESEQRVIEHRLLWCLHHFVSIIYHLIPAPACTRDEYAVIDPAVSRIASLQRAIESHLELVGSNAGVLSELLYQRARTGTGAGGLDIDSGTVVGLEVVARIEVCCLLIVVIVDDFPI